MMGRASTSHYCISAQSSIYFNEANTYAFAGNRFLMSLPEPRNPLTHHDVRSALQEIIEGKNVKRIQHDLRSDGRDFTEEFIEELTRRGYRPATVAMVDVKPGERVPAFYVDGGVAHFGWVFWEQFTSWKIRKLWGSVKKNVRGDWDIQIPSGKPATIYANPLLKIEMDIDHPPEF